MDCLGRAEKAMRTGGVFFVLIGATIVLLIAVGTAAADDARPPAAATERSPHPAEATGHPESKSDADGRTSGEVHRLPPDSVTQQTIVINGQSQSFKATAGAIHLSDTQGIPQADVAFIAFQLDGAEPTARPVTFALNGGPGTASGWLQLGALGPWRLPMSGDAVASSAVPNVIDNADCWLDFTDLVFIDPPGTGYSRIVAAGDQPRRRFWSVDGDIGAIAEAIRLWLETNSRLASPKFIAGESYGGFRGPKLVRELQRENGIGIRGVVLISPALDFGFNDGFFNPFQYLVRLPAFAATAREANGPIRVDDLADVEQYATGDYLSDFLRGERDTAAVARMAENVARLSGLDPALVRKYGGRIDAQTFRREFDRRHGRFASAYDATISVFDPDPFSPYSRVPDALTDALEAPVTAAMTELVTHRLGWHPDGRYILSNLAVNRAWEWGRGQQEAATDLRTALAFDPQFKALVTHGMSDLVTPYLGSKLILSQITDFGGSGRLVLKVYGGGHMHYSRDDSRRQLHEDARRLIQGQ
jgi:carboxypeptidase C (cathepsin A)